MFDRTKHEELALDYAVKNSGEVVEELMTQGVGSDLAKWSEADYRRFVTAAVEGYSDKLRAIGMDQRKRLTIRPEEVPF